MAKQRRHQETAKLPHQNERRWIRAQAMRGNNTQAITTAAGVIDRITRIYGLDRSALGDGVGEVSALITKLVGSPEEGNKIDE